MKRRNFIKAALALAVTASPLAALAVKASNTRHRNRGLVYYEDYGDYDNSRNLVTKEYVDKVVVPTGYIEMFSGDKIPDGWALCDGQNGTPDFRARFWNAIEPARVSLGEDGSWITTQPEKPYATIGYIIKIK